MLVHRREIIGQTSREAAGRRSAPRDHSGRHARRAPSTTFKWRGLQRCTRGPCARRPCPCRTRILIWIDEAHHCPATTYRKIIDAYPQAILLGTTATPCRGDGRGLGGDLRVHHRMPADPGADRGSSTSCRPRVYAPVLQGPDLKGVRTQAGDYVETPTRRAHGPAGAGRRYRHALAQVRRAPQDGCLRRRRRAQPSPPERIRPQRRPRRARRRRHAEARARRDPRPTGQRRNRTGLRIAWC